MPNNQELWERMSSLYYDKRVEEALALWTEDARYEAVYPVDGLPAVVEGRPALIEMFSGLVAVAERIEVQDVRFHETSDPNVVFIEERMVIDVVDGSRYENRVVMRITFRDGLIAEMVEYADPRENETFLERLGQAAAGS
jgi:ketosteroid isomerase-like protein